MMLSQGYVSSLLSPFLPRLTSPQRNPFDIGHTTPDPFPPPYALGYLNNAWVRQALNVPVNFTDKTSVVLNSTPPFSTSPTPTTNPLLFLDFIGFGDFPRSSVPALQSLLNSGVKVALGTWNPQLLNDQPQLTYRLVRPTPLTAPDPPPKTLPNKY